MHPQFRANRAIILFLLTFYCIIICFAHYFINKFINNNLKRNSLKNLMVYLYSKIFTVLQIFRRIQIIFFVIYFSVHIIHLEFFVFSAISSLQLLLSHSLFIIPIFRLFISLISFPCSLLFSLSLILL